MYVIKFNIETKVRYPVNLLIQKSSKCWMKDKKYKYYFILIKQTKTMLPLIIESLIATKVLILIMIKCNKCQLWFLIKIGIAHISLHQSLNILMEEKSNQTCYDRSLVVTFFHTLLTFIQYYLIFKNIFNNNFSQVILIIHAVW